MRTTIMLASALAATALAKPLEKRQVVVTSVDVVYTTDIVTVTAGQSAAETVKPSKVPHKHHHHSSQQPSSYPVATTTQAPAPVYTTTTTEAPAPVQTTTTTEAPAPSSYSAPAQSSATTAAPEPSSTGGVATTYQQAVVDHHNYHRTNHSAPAIAWDDALAATAMKIAQTCVYAHSMDVDGGGYGQNIAAGVGASEVGRTISDLFYNGEVSKFTQYGVANPDMSTFEGWGHFSQIVWKDTTKVGCATWNCNSKGLQNFYPNSCDPSTGATCYSYYTVCNYNPAGNVGGEYGDNIGNSLNQATVPGSANVNTGDIGSSYCTATDQPTN